MLLYFAYAIVAHRGFYPRGFGSLLRTMVAFTVSVLFFMLSLGGIFAVNLVVRLMLARARMG